MDAIGGARPVHHDGRRPGVAVLAQRPARRPAARLTTSRSSRRSRTSSIPRSEPTRPAIRWLRPENPFHPTGDPRYPLVATSYRLTEHHTTGAMSRNLPWLDELQPEMFAEIDPQLAADRGIEDGGWMTIVTERAEIEARARVTDRMRPLRVDGRLLHQVGAALPLGLLGRRPGDSTNDLGVLSGDPNVSIQESKAFTCDVRAGRRQRPSTARLAGAPAARAADPRRR